MKRLAVAAVVGALSLSACTSSPTTEESAESAAVVVDEVVIDEDVTQSEAGDPSTFTEEDIAISAGD